MFLIPDSKIANNKITIKHNHFYQMMVTWSWLMPPFPSYMQPVDIKYFSLPANQTTVQLILDNSHMRVNKNPDNCYLHQIWLPCASKKAAA